MTKLQIAEMCHEVNRLYCKSLGDNLQPTWIDAPMWMKESTIKGVEYKLNNLNATPEDQHKAWMKDKLADGWKYGLVKDANKKEHPCLVDYNKLPIEQRIKDSLFCAIVTTTAPTLTK